jgi:hypothetical protein
MDSPRLGAEKGTRSSNFVKAFVRPPDAAAPLD